MDVLITPQRIIEDRLARRGISLEDLAIAPTVVLSWRQDVVESLAEATGATQVACQFRFDRPPHFRGEVAGQALTLMQVPVGAPVTVGLMEELIVCGARSFIALGWAGSIQPHITIGNLLIPTTCVREEGTSHHYVPSDALVQPDSGLAAALQQAAQAQGEVVYPGPHWTIDAPYRELRSKVDAYRARGVQAVDMETSAMYALAAFRQVRVCNLLVVSDELGQDWNHAFSTERLRQADRRAERVILQCLANGI